VNIKEKFIDILEHGKEDEIVPFLKSLSSENKKSLAPTIKKIGRDLRIVTDTVNPTFPTPIIEILYNGLLKPSNSILTKASFVCLSYDEMRRAAEHISLEEIEYDILPWYQPSWLNRYFLEMADFYIDYEKMLVFMDKGWLKPTKQFIADNTAYGLLDSKDKLEENIWYLFEYYTTIANDDRWINRFKELIVKGDIDRTRVLKESLLTSNRGFNKPFTGYFCKLFTALEPTDDELLALQNELILSLSSPHSKPISDALKYIKRICKNSHFDLENFIQQLEPLLISNTKTIVNATLSLIDVLIKTYPKHKDELALLLVQALAQEDEVLQIKTIKLLVKHKQLTSTNILDEISIYLDGLYHTTKQLLPTLEQTTQDTDEVIEIIPPQYIRDDNKITIPQTFEEIVFFFSQVFEGKNIYDFDLFVTLLPKLYLGINVENLSKLEPVFHNALKCYAHPSMHQNKEIIDMMAQGFLYFGYTYLKSFDILYDKISQHYIKVIKDEEERDRKKTWLKSKLINFKVKPQSASVFNIHHQLILIAFEKIQNSLSHEPLFITTHSPCWIDANILSERLKVYEQNNETIHPFELQIALSRVVFNENNKIHSNHTEINALLEYMQTATMSLPVKIIENPSFWLTPLLRKNSVNDLEIFAKHFQKEKHDIPFSHIFDGNITYRNATNTTFTSHCVQLIRSLDCESIYSYTRIWVDDLPFALALTPTLPNFLLEARYKTPQTDFEVIMPILIDIWGNYGDNNYLFIARTFTDTSKITRQFTSELWIKATLEGAINHQLLGETIGKLEHNEYAPLKRFTDLIVSNMLNISTLHNQGLHTLLSSMIVQMNDEPIKGTKKLLEIYLEVLSLTKLDVPSETVEKLEIWGEVKSLKSIVKKLDKN
jgi:hypothetical protein